MNDELDGLAKSLAGALLFCVTAEQRISVIRAALAVASAIGALDVAREQAARLQADQALQKARAA